MNSLLLISLLMAADDVTLTIPIVKGGLNAILPATCEHAQTISLQSDPNDKRSVIVYHRATKLSEMYPGESRKFRCKHNMLDKLLKHNPQWKVVR